MARRNCDLISGRCWGSRTGWCCRKSRAIPTVDLDSTRAQLEVGAIARSDFPDEQPVSRSVWGFGCPNGDHYRVAAAHTTGSHPWKFVTCFVVLLAWTAVTSGRESITNSSSVMRHWNFRRHSTFKAACSYSWIQAKIRPVGLIGWSGLGFTAAATIVVEAVTVGHCGPCKAIGFGSERNSQCCYLELDQGLALAAERGKILRDAHSHLTGYWWAWMKDCWCW